MLQSINILLNKSKSILEKASLFISRKLFGSNNTNNSFLNYKFIRKLIAFGHPLGHYRQSSLLALIKGTPGLGLFYYTLARILKPENVVCIGALRGFSFLSFAVALKENNKGHLYFIDPSFVDDFWKDALRVKNHLRKFGVDKVVTHFLSTSAEAVRDRGIFSAKKKFIDILYIDGSHDLEHVKFDFEVIGSYVKTGGVILLHDALIKGEGYSRWEVGKFIKTIDKRKFEIIHLPVGSGLALVRKL